MSTRIAENELYLPVLLMAFGFGLNKTNVNRKASAYPENDILEYMSFHQNTHCLKTTNNVQEF